MAEPVPVTPNDYTDLSLFLTNFQDETRKQQYWLDRFNLWWDGNPAFLNGMERGWIIKKDGNILGFFGIIPSKFYLFGRETVVSNATSWRVLPEYRSNSLRLFINFMGAPENSILFSTTPNAVVRKILRTAGFRLIPRYDRSITTVVINIEKVLISKFNGIAKTLIKLFFSSWINRLYHWIITKEQPSFEVKEVTKADLLFDQLWERTKNIYPNTNVRTRDIINWYCFGSKYHRKKIFGCFGSGWLRGYIIFWDYGYPERWTLECLDLWVEPGSQNVVESLIRAAVKYACQHSFDFVSFPHFNKEMRDSLKKLGLKKVSLMKEKDYFKINVGGPDKISEENSYFVRAQGDIGL